MDWESESCTGGSVSQNQKNTQSRPAQPGNAMMVLSDCGDEKDKRAGTSK